MSHESVWYSRPRTYGKGSRSWYVLCHSPPHPFQTHHIIILTAMRCVRTDNHSVVTGERKHAGVIRKYGLNMSRQAFREKAADIGFVKVC